MTTLQHSPASAEVLHGAFGSVTTHTAVMSPNLMRGAHRFYGEPDAPGLHGWIGWHYSSLAGTARRFSMVVDDFGTLREVPAKPRRMAGFVELNLVNWLGALALALVLALSCNLDGPSDHKAEWDQSQALKDLQASQAGTARRDAAAQRLCDQERGPQSEARWTPEGHLVCSSRRGPTTARVLEASL